MNTVWSFSRAFKEPGSLVLWTRK